MTSALIDVLKLLGWAALVFFLQDLIVKGNWQRLWQMTLTDEGRLLVFITIVIVRILSYRK